MNRDKLELHLNEKIEVELLYDDPITGENAYGNYFMYAVKCGKSEYSFFAPEPVHDELKHLRKGDTAIIKKNAVKKGNKVVTNYEVTTPQKVAQQNAINSHTPAPIVNEKPKLSESFVKEQGNLSDNFFELMLNSYSDALEIQNRLENAIDVTKIAITLYISRTKGNGNTFRSEVS
jgi:hypothetical protein